MEFITSCAPTGLEDVTSKMQYTCSVLYYTLVITFSELSYACVGGLDQYFAAGIGSFLLISLIDLFSSLKICHTIEPVHQFN
jgi:hypothetical protein